jgi:amino acid efflux transporter
MAGLRPARHRLAFFGDPGWAYAALHIATAWQALGWHNEQLLLAELGTLAIVWWVGSRGASSSANLQTLVAVLIVALIAAIWWAGDIPGRDPFPAITDVDHSSCSPHFR